MSDVGFPLAGTNEQPLSTNVCWASHCCTIVYVPEPLLPVAFPGPVTRGLPWAPVTRGLPWVSVTRGLPWASVTRGLLWVPLTPAFPGPL